MHIVPRNRIWASRLCVVPIMLSKNTWGGVPCLSSVAKGNTTEFLCTSGEETLIYARASVKPVVLWRNNERLTSPRRDKWDFMGKDLIFFL